MGADQFIWSVEEAGQTGPVCYQCGLMRAGLTQDELTRLPTPNFY